MRVNVKLLMGKNKAKKRLIYFLYICVYGFANNKKCFRKGV